MNDDGLIKKQFGNGDLIFAENDMGDAAYIVESGSVEISKSSGRGEAIINVVKPGKIMGEMALIDRSPRMATARAIGKTTLIVIPNEAMDKILKQTDPVVRVILHELLGQLRDSDQKNVNQTL